MHLCMTWSVYKCIFQGRLPSLAAPSHRLNVRVEHLTHSRCREDFKKRVKENDRIKHEAKAKGTKVICKRQPAQPRPAHKVNVTKNKPEFLTPLPYEFIA